MTPRFHLLCSHCRPTIHGLDRSTWFPRWMSGSRWERPQRGWDREQNLTGALEVVATTARRVCLLSGVPALGTLSPAPSTGRRFTREPGRMAQRHLAIVRASSSPTVARNGTAHIEIHAVRRPGAEPLAHDVEHMLQSLKGVQWADVDAVFGRVIVAFDGGSLELDNLVDVVEAVEEAHGVRDERFGHDRPDHPADHVLSQRALAEVIADTAGLGLSVFGSVLRLSPLPVESPASCH